MNAMTSLITAVSSVCPTVCPGADQRKHQNCASLAFVRGIHRWPLSFILAWHQTVQAFTWTFVLVFQFALRHQGWGLLSQFSPFLYFPHLPLLSKQTLAIEYHVYIWQVSPQLSCGDSCQLWMWFWESNRYFCKIENFAYGEISERSFSNSHPRPLWSNAIELTYLKRDDMVDVLQTPYSRAFSWMYLSYSIHWCVLI